MKETVHWQGKTGNDYYSTAIRAGDFIFVSGQGPIDPVTDKIVGNNVEEQTRYTLQNIFSILEAAGAKPEDIVKVNAYLRDIADYAKFNEVYREMMPGVKPARTTVGTQLVDILIEIDCIAHAPK